MCVEFGDLPATLQALFDGLGDISYETRLVPVKVRSQTRKNADYMVFAKVAKGEKWTHMHHTL